MVKRGIASRSLCPALLLGAAALIAVCRVPDLREEGRFCTATQPCAEGYRCDLSKSTCVASPSPDAGLQDLPLTEGPMGDQPQIIDRIPVDLPPPPDGNCAPMVLCLNRCVDTATDPDHCGACGNSCKAKGGDLCVAGTCVCGTSGSLCGTGLDCINGNCRCRAGAAGRCSAGCCQGPYTCVPFASQTASKCGSAGQPCTGCYDDSPCTADSCSSGTCHHADVSNGTVCDDDVFCTTGTTCQLGQCAGGYKTSCPATGNECTKAYCSTATDQCEEVPVGDGTTCSQGTCQSGVCQPPPDLGVPDKAIAPDQPPVTPG